MGEHAITTAVLHVLLSSPAGPPNPGTGTAPPGFQGLELILKWVAWVVDAACIFGILFVAGQMALRHQRGEGGQHVAALGWVLAACILVGAASSLVTALV